jgi:hypothetical protein
MFGTSESHEGTDIDDLQTFLMAHKGHKIVELEIIEGTFFSKNAHWEPIREDYLQATDGYKTYTIKRSRSDINEPMVYNIVDFDIGIEEPIFRVQSVDLKKQMIYDNKILGLSERKIDEFIYRFKSFVSDIDPDDLIEVGLSVDDPSVSYAALKSEAMEKFLYLSGDIFTSEEMKRLRIFIDMNLEYNDVMNIMIIRPFHLVRKKICRQNQDYP